MNYAKINRWINKKVWNRSNNSLNVNDLFKTKNTDIYIYIYIYIQAYTFVGWLVFYSMSILVSYLKAKLLFYKPVVSK